MITQAQIQKAVAVIQKGGVVLFPTDTVYGLAADPYNTEAIARLYRLKQRSQHKAMSCIFPNIKQIEQWAFVDARTRAVLEKYLPGPFTFILKARKSYPLGGDTVGARIPKHPVTAWLARALGNPYTATSANVSGASPLQSVTGLSFVVDYSIDGGDLLPALPSTVVDLTQTPSVIVRQGSGIFTR